MAGRPARASFASVVLIDSSLSHLDRAFTYRIPEGMSLDVGALVRVPFRRKNHDGIVVEMIGEPHVEKTLDVAAVLGPGLDAELVELCSHVASNYLSTFGEALAAAVPDRVVEEEQTDRVAPIRVGARSLSWLNAYRGGLALQKALAGRRYAGFSWRPGPDRPGEIAAMAATVAARGRGVLILLPEVRVEGEAAGALETLGDAVAWLGSDRGARDRYRAWLSVRTGRRPIAVGGRAAVYAPVRNLGLVVIDDESNVSYKERRAPRIHARAVAAERARTAGAVLVAVGTPPSIEAGHAVERGVLTQVSVTRGELMRTRPPVAVVDRSRDERRLVPHADSIKLAAEELRRGRRVVFLIHRAGDDSRNAADRAFRILEPRHPALLDGRSSPDELAAAVQSADCIVATPVIAKDLSIEHVGVVAILEADAALAVPEFRAAEEAFATWWHVARWATGGRVVIETAQPDHPAVRALVRWDPDSLYQWEASRRMETGYPPFAGLVRIDTPAERGDAVAAEVRRALPGSTVLGPLDRGGKAVVIVRSASRKSLIEGLRPLAGAWRQAGEPFRIDVDPREVLP